MSQKIWSVATLVQYVKMKLDQDSFIQNIMIQGEISNFTAHHSGHFYFTLKDQKARISCVMFSRYTSSVKAPIQNGMQVILTGSISMFESAGQVQFYATKMEAAGIGDLFLRYEQLKKQLFEEGLFEEGMKKKLPLFPMNIALVTGKDTAAKRDVLITLHRRWPIAKITEFNTLVQGDKAYLDIIENLSRADIGDYDVILLVRGGGSLEDLWAFNEEALVRFIHQMKTPVVTGVGHEIDTTLVDYVSDKRAATPTAAAELITPNIEEIKQQLNVNKQRLIQAVNQKKKVNQQRLDWIKQTKIWKYPEQLYQNERLTLMMYTNQFKHFVTVVEQFKITLQNNEKRLSMISQSYVTQNQLQTMNLKNRLIEAQKHLIEKRKQEFGHQIQLLDAYSPLNTLKRGYGIISVDHTVITSIKEVEEKQEIKIRLEDGTIQATVLNKEEV